MVFLVSTALASHHRWLAWVQATAVAAMVGGLADWFAVTALFRRPLGLPIPHTAIIVERKDRFGETLGAFVQESFLSADAVTERLRAAHALDRTTAWLADPSHAEIVAARLLDVAVTATDLVANDDVHELFDSLVRGRLERTALAPTAGRILDRLTRNGRHQQLVDAGLDRLSHYLGEHGLELYHQLGRRSARWIPGPVETRVVNRFVDRGRAVLADMAADRSHPLRVHIDEGLVLLARNLQTSPELAQRGQDLLAELLAQPQLRATALAVWEDARKQLRTETDNSASPLRTRLAALLVRGATQFRGDPSLVASTERAVEAALATTLDRFETELASLVSGTIARWDATETARRLELLLGPDLQYIRINGTVVGGLAGLALHGVTRLLG